MKRVDLKKILYMDFLIRQQVHRHIQGICSKDGYVTFHSL